jgi:hypothetical protein
MNYSLDWSGRGEAEATHVDCIIPEGASRDEFQPFPGSETAVKQGCTCPIQRRWPHSLRFALDCAVHELERHQTKGVRQCGG